MADVISKRARNLDPSVTLSLTAKAKELKAKGENVVGLTAGEPDFDTPDVIKEGAIEAIRRGETKYTPAEGIAPLRKAVAEAYSKRLGVSYTASEIVISHGAKHSIYNALFALMDPGDEVLILSPYWTSYPDMVKILGGKPRIVELTKKTDFKLTTEIFRKQLSRKKKPKALLFNSPSNPAGIVYRKEEIEAIAKIVLESGIALISDEIYEYLTYSGSEHYSPVSLLPQVKDQTVVITGVSKSYAMTGWRVGFAMAEKDVAYRMAAFQAHATGCPNSVSQWAALEALQNGADDRERMRGEFEKRKELFGKRLARIPSIWYPEPGGAFYYLVDVSKLYKKCNAKNSFEFCDKLLAEQGLVVIPGGAFGCDKMIRFSFAASENDINRALDRFENFARKYSS
ncbi:MAG: pyridoxal phosphate-dependent aminotransferase [Candidatus Krumholzibacteria bacterium]|nr:pyridoxal phosphate-dependent aminotransferase [Candidatus Krumholzibacteria bacterium]